MPPVREVVQVVCLCGLLGETPHIVTPLSFFGLSLCYLTERLLARVPLKDSSLLSQRLSLLLTSDR